MDALENQATLLDLALEQAKPKLLQVNSLVFVRQHITPSFGLAAIINDTALR